MPELPEVEAQRATLERTCVGLQVSAVLSTEQGGGGRDGLFDDKIIAEEMTGPKLDSALVGKWIIGARRKGKQMWLELGQQRGDIEASSSLLIHLGMTGAVSIRGEEGPKYKRLDPSQGGVWPPRFTKLELRLSNGLALAFSDPRRFGRILLRAGDARLSPPVSQLASDPFLDPLSAELFVSALQRIAAPIKAVLLDQNRLFCGIGNWVADEVLYQAKILPSSPSKTLSPEQALSLHEAILQVCAQACAVGADSARFPASWLFHHRWANQTTGSITSPLGRIHFETVGGRTTAFLPLLQKAGAGQIESTDADAKRVKAAPKRARQASPAAAEPQVPVPKKARRARSTSDATAAPKEASSAKGKEAGAADSVTQTRRSSRRATTRGEGIQAA